MENTPSPAAEQTAPATPAACTDMPSACGAQSSENQGVVMHPGASATPEAPASETSESPSAPSGIPALDASNLLAERIAELNTALAKANREIARLKRALEQTRQSAFDRGRAQAIEELHHKRVDYYRNLREAGARASGTMPDSSPASLLCAAPRRSFWD